MIKWYNTVGEKGEVVLNTGIRFARNLKEFPFPCKLNAEDLGKVTEKIKAVAFANLPGEITYMDMGDLTPVQRLSLAERHIISPDFAGKEKGYGLFLTPDESLSIMLCEQDHIRIQSVCSGLDLESSFDTASDIEAKFANELEFAFDERIGYLTQSPRDLGTAMRACIMLHLPALTYLDRIQRFAGAVSALGLSMRPVYGTKSRMFGDIYQVSNTITLGIDEKTAMKNLNSIVLQIISQEQLSASKLANDPDFQDKIFRSFGILQNARMLRYDEFMDMISLVRFGASQNMLPIPLEITNALIIGGQPATLSATSGAENSTSARDAARANLVREALK